MHRLISRQEAAELLGCEPQTISNWISKGVLKSHEVSGRVYVDSKTITDNLDTFQDAVNTQKEITKLSAHLHAKEEQLRNGIEDKLKELRLWGKYFPAAINRQILTEFFMSFRGVLTEGDAELMCDLINFGETRNIELSTLGNKYGITVLGLLERVRSIVRKIRMTPSYTSLRDENAGLKVYAERLKADNHELQKKVDEFDTSVELSEADADIYYHMRELLSRRLEDIPTLSTRTLNCLRCNEIETVADLVVCEERELLRIRSFGKKCLEELRQYLDSVNLEFGMNVNKYFVNHGQDR